MLIKILDTVKEYENRTNELDEVFKYIDEELSNNNLHFSHLNIDGTEVYDNHYEYIEDNIDRIIEIMVITKSIKEFVDGVIDLKIEYIKRALPELDVLTNALYKSSNQQDDWLKIADLFEALQWLLEATNIIDNQKNLNLILKYQEWNEYGKIIFNLKELVAELKEAIEANDVILLADLLSYELKAIFKEGLDKLIELRGSGEEPYVHKREH